MSCERASRARMRERKGIIGSCEEETGGGSGPLGISVY